jgi:outer membrane protein W
LHHHANYFPVTLTGKYYFLAKNIQPYGGVDIGFYTIGWKEIYKEQSFSVSDSHLNFCFAPVVGLQFKLPGALALDVNAKYNVININTLNYNYRKTKAFPGFNAGIVYTFGK